MERLRWGETLCGLTVDSTKAPLDCVSPRIQNDFI